MESSSFLYQTITYIPEEWRLALFRGVSLPGQAEGAALFSDISGFTPISEALVRAYGLRQGAEELPRYINLGGASAAQMPGYTGAALANQAWIAWKKGDYRTTQEQARAAIVLWDSDPAIRSVAMPLSWLAFWPLLGVHLVENQLAQAVSAGRSLLESWQMDIPGELADLLKEAITAWDNHQPETVKNSLQQWINLAEKLLLI